MKSNEEMARNIAEEIEQIVRGELYKDTDGSLVDAPEGADEDTVKYLASIGSDCGDGCWYWRTYCFVEKSSMIDGVRVLDRLPTVEEVRGCVLSDPDSYGDIVSTGRMTVICPTPCGFYDEDDWRWEVCYVELDDDGEVSLPDYVNGCTAHTLDEAIRFAIDELNSERIYIARESV